MVVKHVCDAKDFKQNHDIWHNLDIGISLSVILKFKMAAIIYNTAYIHV